MGQKVKPIGNGLTSRGEIYDIVIDHTNDQIYAVGNSTAINGMEINNVGVLSNGQWQAMPDSSVIDGVVMCAEIHDGALYIGGYFTIGESSKIMNLAKLENGVWKDVGIDRISGSIRDLTWFKDELYVTGDFRTINGVRNHGVMKYSNGEWKDSGLNSFLNSEGLFVSGDTLVAWGNGFYGDEGYAHTVSYFTNDTWTTLPNFRNTPSVSRSCTVYEGDIYATNQTQLFRYDKNTNLWDQAAWIPVASESPQLFNYKGSLYIVTDRLELFQYRDGHLEQVAVDGYGDDFTGKVHTVAVNGDELIIGGHFSDWDTKSISLARIRDDKLVSFGKVSSATIHIDARDYSLARSIVRYNNKYLVAGRFSFADNVYSPNLVYWDETKFIPFEVPLSSGIRKLVEFENELYALPYPDGLDPELASYKLIKYNGERWEGVDVPTRLDDIDVIGDKLFVLHEYTHYSDEGGPFYIQNGEWHELKPYPVSGPISRYGYRNINAYKEGYIMSVTYWTESEKIVYLPNDTSEWEVLVDTIGVQHSRIHTLDDEIYLSQIWPQHIYRINNRTIDTIALDIGTENPNFFSVGEQHYYSAWNIGMYRVRDSLEYYNSLRVTDVAKIDENNYLLALQGSRISRGRGNKDLNIGILSFEPLTVSIDQDRSSICPKNYAQYWASTDHVNVNYSWEFDGGIPSHSTSFYPMVRYDSAGVYEIKMIASNIDGDTVEQITEIFIEDCDVPISIDNNYDNHWIMGYDFEGRGLGGFDFTFSDTVLSPRYLSPKELSNGSIVMSDKNGFLKFYSNGISIFNMHNQAIKGSECFNSHLDDYSLDYFISNQSLLSLPDSNNDDLYHIFDLDPHRIDGAYWLAASDLSMTTIDMSRNNGLGEVINCNEVVIEDVLLNSTMQATRHANGVDWWIIVGKYQSDKYYKILLTKNGVASVKLSEWDSYYDSTFSGQSTFSPDGNYFAQIIKESQEVAIWRFDNTNGELYDKQTITIATLDDREFPYGCSFSPNSRFLYVSSLTQIRQLDLCDYNDIESVWIDSWDGAFEFIYPLYFGKQMLSPDKQIVVTPYGNSHYSFGVIENPDEKGVQCRFKQHSLQISDETRNNADVIPIFPHFRTYPTYEGDCGSVGVKPIEAKNSLMAYPNPVGHQSVLHFNKTIAGEVYDIRGNLVLTFGATDYLDIKSLSSGVYIIKSIQGVIKVIK